MQTSKKSSNSQSRNFLIFNLTGLMASWSTAGKKTFVERNSEPRPTKSGIIGYIAACLGYERNDKRYADLFSLLFGCIILKTENWLSDFHTIRYPDKNSNGDLIYQNRFEELNGNTDKFHHVRTEITRRGYLVNVSYVIVITGNDNILSLIKNAIEKPIFTPYLGRKCCPVSSRPLPLIVKAENMMEAVKLYDTDVADDYIVAAWDNGIVSGIGESRMEMISDMPVGDAYMRGVQTLRVRNENVAYIGKEMLQ